MIRSIIKASLTIPILILTIFSGAGIVFLVLKLLDGSEYNNDWFGIVYAGLIYAYFAVLISSIPTLVFGYPMSLLAKKHNMLNTKVILLGATTLGALFLSFAGTIFFNTFNQELFWWLAFIGALGGLLNGYVFLSRLKPNKTIKFVREHPPIK